MSDLSNPHDNFFKELLSLPRNARDFLRYYLPPAIVAEFDLRSVELVKDAFIDAELQKHLADLLYRVRLKRGDEAFVFVLFEHKSAPDRWVTLQILRYIVRLWEQTQASGAKQLPPVYPIVLYHGCSRWKVPRNLRALVAMQNDSPLLQFVPEFEYYLVDLTTLREEDLHGAPYLQAGLWALKLIFERELARHLPGILQKLRQKLQGKPEPSVIEHLKTLVKYLSKVKNAIEPQQLKQAIEQVFADQGEQFMAEFFQEWINQGREQGLQQGIALGEVKGMTSLTLSLLQHRLGRLPKITKEQIKGLSAKQLESLGVALLDFKSQADLDAWLRKHTAVN
ncbi:MAG TPA: Rpn family recombination-promoting nuclease/putative transposase [Blastocatellia bacterium]|nr:Rpn family recombination-promoting nuclease/putative transposase [Blastocatellia bacterium]